VYCARAAAGIGVEEAVGFGVEVNGTAVEVEGMLVEVGLPEGVEQELIKKNNNAQDVTRTRVDRCCMRRIVNEKGLPPTGGLSQLIVI
jgi:hypothetical protein